MTITVITGPPCSGKTTYLASSARPGDIIIDFDALAAALGSPASHGAPRSLRNVAHAARYAAINAALKVTDTDVFIIHSQPNTQWMDRYTAAHAIIKVIDPGIGECLRRAADDNRPDWTAQAIRQWYRRDAVAKPADTHQSWVRPSW